MKLALVPFLDFFLGSGLHVLDEALNQPHPLYLEGNWFTLSLPNALRWGCLLAAAMTVVAAIDFALSRFDGVSSDQLRYRPTLRGVSNATSHAAARIVLIVGALLLAGWLVGTEIALWHARMFTGGLVWPMPRVFGAGLTLWGLLWVADALSRPRCETLLAATVSLMLAVMFVAVMPGILRE